MTAPLVPSMYPDELLYSFLGRLHWMTCADSPKRTLEDLFGHRNVRAGPFLQTKLGLLAKNLPAQRGLTAERLAVEATLLPYLVAFQPHEARSWAMETMIDSNAVALNARLGLAAGVVRLPAALRYCPICRTEMLALQGELYWKREHQLPGVLVCRRHGVPLADSLVRPLEHGQHEFIYADESNCPIDPPAPVWADAFDVLKLLREIANASWALLTLPPPPTPLSAWGEIYRAALMQRGLGRRVCNVDQSAVKDLYLQHFGPVLGVISEAEPDGWLAAMSRKHRKAIAPLRHILLQLLIDSLPRVERTNPFGSGPWSCRNPLADHRGQLVITDCQFHQDHGKTIGVFRCSCGYAFSEAPEPGARAKGLDLGPQFTTRLRELVAAGGTSLRGTARALQVDPNTVLRYVSLLGLDAPWEPRPGRLKQRPVERDTMRAAWREGRAAARGLTRKQLRAQIPAVYAWLYRNDRDWLNAQPPVAIKPVVSRPRHDWPAIDAEASEILRREGVRLRLLSPPVPINLSALERALGQFRQLERRLAKLPMCSAVLNELTESVDDFRRRKTIWAADELRRQHRPVKVWRLRRLAGLPGLCPPAVEMALRAAAERTE